MPDEPVEPQQVIDELVAAAEPGVVALGSGRYFGFVIGGALPAALAADWLTSTWDQNAGLYVGGPSASVVEQVTRGWLVDLLGLPAESSVGFVTGTQMAHVTGLAAARWHVLDAVGWDVGAEGLTGAPRVTRARRREAARDRRPRAAAARPRRARRSSRADYAGPAACPTRLREALGDGPDDRLRAGRRGEHRRLRPAAGDRRRLPRPPAPGSTSTAPSGSGPPSRRALRHLVAGLERADSWTTDAHKWLNVPYDSGIVFCAHPESHRAAMTIAASYLIQDEGAQRVRDEVDWVPEFSRRARGFAVYAALRSLGRSGLVELVERCCDAAARFAERIVELDGVELLNEVVLNQVLFRFESDERTDEVLRARAGERPRLAERHHLGRSQGDPRLRLELADRRRGDRPRRRAFYVLRGEVAGPVDAGPRAGGRRCPPARSRSRSARRGRRPVSTPSCSSR